MPTAPTVYEEGKDFRAVQDAKLFNDPPGDFGFNHRGAELRLIADSRIKEGDKLRVSWYHPIVVHGEQVMCCLTEPKVYDLLRDQAKRVNDLLKPATFFMSHDEIRVAGWCKSCQAVGQDAGRAAGRQRRQCVDILKEVNPKAKIVVWSDMFDPNHNAVNELLPRQRPAGRFVEGTAGERDDRQLERRQAGGEPEVVRRARPHADHRRLLRRHDLKNFQKWDAAAKGVQGVTGFMYTTWQHKFDHLEAYGRAMLGKE